MTEQKLTMKLSFFLGLQLTYIFNNVGKSWSNRVAQLSKITLTSNYRFCGYFVGL